MELGAHRTAKALAIGDDVAAEAPVRVDHESTDRRIGKDRRSRQPAEGECGHRRDLAVCIEAQRGRRLLHPRAHFGERCGKGIKVGRIKL